MYTKFWDWRASAMVGLTGAASTRTRCLLALMLAPSVLANTLPQEFIQNAEDALIVRCESRQISSALIQATGEKRERTGHVGRGESARER